MGDILVTINQGQPNAKPQCGILEVMRNTEGFDRSWESNESPNCIEGMKRRVIRTCVNCRPDGV